MAIANNTLNSIYLDSFFQERILDNNGVSVTDINSGLVNLFTKFNEEADNFSEEQRFLVSEFEEGYPDLIAKHSILGDQEYWWWVLLLNRLEDPMEDLKSNWMYSINSKSQIDNFINKSNDTGNSDNNKRIGSVVELN
ncbi:MAG: hypothetical protein IJ880_02640 [Bacilli bacterium]|nr:hypothetical protein [Bacilli bacterium]